MKQRNEPSTAEIVVCAKQCFGIDWEYKGCEGCSRITPQHVSLGRVLDCRYDLGIELADRLEQLERENAEKDAQIAALTTRAEKAEAERDAEVSGSVLQVLVDVQISEAAGTVHVCDYCVHSSHGGSICEMCTAYQMFKYCGL